MSEKPTIFQQELAKLDAWREEQREAYKGAEQMGISKEEAERTIGPIKSDEQIKQEALKKELQHINAAADKDYIPDPMERRIAAAQKKYEQEKEHLDKRLEPQPIHEYDKERGRDEEQER